MNGSDIRDYSGDFEDVAELARRVWISQYGGKMWFPSWDAAFYRWQLGALGNAPFVAAYDGTRLVGTLGTAPYTLRIGASTVPAGFSGWLNVDPMHRERHLAFGLVDALRRRHEDLGLAFSLGVVSSDRGSSAHRFWTKYSAAHPGDFQFLFPLALWIKILTPQRMAQAAIAGWERIAARTLFPLLRAIPPGRDPDVRPYRADDLARCAQMLQAASSDFEWAVVWSPEQLANQLESPASGTLVLERDGRVQGMVNYHFFLLHGRVPLRAAMIDLWADDGLTGTQRARLLGHLCGDLRERGFDVVAAIRSAMTPAAAFVTNLFLPQPPFAYMISYLRNGEVQVSKPKTWSLILR